MAPLPLSMMRLTSGSLFGPLSATVSPTYYRIKDRAAKNSDSALFTHEKLQLLTRY